MTSDNIFRRKLGITVVIALLCVSTSAKSLTDTIAEARATIRENFVPKTPGLSVAVARYGKILWSEGFGFADLEAKIPVTPQTEFRIGSISKPLTAAGLMLLVENEKLDLDAYIHRYVPDYPDKGALITTRQLAGHLAGIRHYQGDEMHSNKHYDTVRQSLKIFENDPLLSKPGTKFFYSSYGWNLISMVMESAAKTNFLSYMQTAVLEPLQLKNTVPDYAGRDVPQRTLFYSAKQDGSFVRAPAVDNSYKWASGGFLSTPEDLVRFGSALLHPGFLKRESLNAMFTSQRTSDGKETGYGIGWFIQRDKEGHRIWLHTGGSIGGTSILMLRPDSGVVIAMTSNCTPSPFEKFNVEPIVEAFSGILTAD